MRQLLLLRHGKSAWPDGAIADFDRPLKARGRAASETMGRWIRDHDLVPDRVLSSTAARARATAAIATRAMGFDAGRIVWTERIYEAGLDRLLYVIEEHAGDAGRLLVIGHNPGMEWLTEFLNDGLPEGGDGARHFPTAALAVIDLDAGWHELGRGTATRARIVRPRELD